MEYHLIVVEPFGDYAKGDRIEDPDKVEEILKSDSADKVRKIKGE